MFLSDLTHWFGVVSGPQFAVVMANGLNGFVDVRDPFWGGNYP